jgi:hypothetical protein
MHPRFVPRFTARLVAAAFITLFAAACEHLPTEPGSLASIVVTRNPDSVAVTGRRNFTATGYDANGTVVGINPVWSAAAGGTISSAGIFTAGTVRQLDQGDGRQPLRHRDGRRVVRSCGDDHRDARDHDARDRRTAAVHRCR